MKFKSQMIFTLIELLVVIAIISILASILLPALRQAKEKVMTVACKNNLRSMGQGLTLYSTDANGMLPPLWNDYPNTGYNKSYAKPYHHGWLYHLNYISQPEVFYCQGDQVYKLDKSQWDNWGSKTVRTSYSYRGPTWAEGFNMLKDTDKAIMCDSFFNNLSLSKHAHNKGFNVLFIDGHCDYYQDPSLSFITLYDYRISTGGLDMGEAWAKIDSKL